MANKSNRIRPLRPASPDDEDLLAGLARRHADGLPATGNAFDLPDAASSPGQDGTATETGDEEDVSDRRDAAGPSPDRQDEPARQQDKPREGRPRDDQQVGQRDDLPVVDPPPAESDEREMPALLEMRPAPSVASDGAALEDAGPAAEAPPRQPATPSGEARPPLDRADPAGEDVAPLTEETAVEQISQAVAIPDRPVRTLPGLALGGPRRRSSARPGPAPADRRPRGRVRPEADPMLRLAVQIVIFAAVIGVIVALFMLTR